MCRGVYYEPKLCVLIVEGPNRIICRTMRRWWVKNRGATLESLPIRLILFWTYDAEFGKLPRKTVNGPGS